MEIENKILKIFKLDKLTEHITGYVETEIELLKLEIREKTEEFLQKIIILAIAGVFIFLFLILFSVGLSLLLNNVLESNYLGFFIISFFYVFLSAILIIRKKNKFNSVFLKKRELSNDDREK